MRALRALLLAALLLVVPGILPAQDTLRSGTVRVVHAPRQLGLAREVLAAARRPMPLPGFGSGAVPDSTTIVLAATPAAWDRATGGAIPEWAGGVAVPEDRLVVLPTYPSAGVRPVDAGATLRHELAHLALHQRLPAPIPRWFDEGYAELASGSWDAESAWQLRVAFALGKVPPLDSLALEWPRGAGRARLAYLLSATAVDHLMRLGGEPGFALLMRNWREEGDLDAAVRTTYGLTLGQVEDAWRKDVRRRYGWLLALSNVAAVWVVATVLVLAAWVPRRRRNRRRMDAMRAEERMLPPPDAATAGVEYPLPDPDA